MALPTDRAFVVQVRADSDPTHGVRGRIEHIASGAAETFETLQELGSFLARALTYQRSTSKPEEKEETMKHTAKTSNLVSTSKSRIALMIAAPLLLLCIAGMPHATQAATITVTTKKDTVADDGFCSLREAVGAANSQLPSGASPGECAAGDALPTIDVIQIPKGKYKLTRGGAREDLNDEGDLDVSESVVIQGAGRRKTVVESAIGSRRAPGDGDRLFHIAPGASDMLDVTFRGLGMRGGDIGCIGTGCFAGASAVEAVSQGHIKFEDCLIAKNATSCVGAACGFQHHSAVIRVVGGASIRVDDSVIEKNSAHCSDFACFAGGSVISTGPAVGFDTGSLLLRNTQLRKNRASCNAQSCVVDPVLRAHRGRLYLQDSTITRNSSYCRGERCTNDRFLDLYSKQVTDILRSEISRNVSRCTGESCEVDNGMVIQSDRTLYVRHSAATKNTVECRGDECDAKHLFYFSAPDVSGTVTLADFDFSRNVQRCVGDSCDVDGALGARAGTIIVSDSAFIKNRNECRGVYCDVDEVVWMGVLHSGDLRLRNINFERNVATCTGRHCDADDAFDFHAAGDLLLDAVTMLKNDLRCLGDGCNVETGVNVYAGYTLLIEDALFQQTRVACKGSSCDVLRPVQVDGDETSIIRHSSFVQNESRCDGQDCHTAKGGALRNYADLLTVSSSTFERNVTPSDGGAIVNAAASSLVLDTVRLRGNRAGGRGGAIYNDKLGGPGILAVYDSEISGNVAAVDGGGISNRGEIVALNGVTFEGNTPTGRDCVDVAEGTGCP